MHLSLVPAVVPPPIPIRSRADGAPIPSSTEPTWALPAIARLLGVHMRSPKWQARYVEQLIANARFPRPLPTMKGEGLVHDILPRRSRWMPAAVTAWLGHQMPADAAAAIDHDAAAQAAAQAADRLDAAADNLFANAGRGDAA